MRTALVFRSLSTVNVCGREVRQTSRRKPEALFLPIKRSENSVEDFLVLKSLAVADSRRPPSAWLEC